MLLTYLSLAIGGCLILLVSLIFGGHDGGDIHGDMHFDMGDDADDGGSDHSWFSVKVLSAFVTAFGAGGAIALSFHTSQILSLFIALISGVSIAAVADAIISLFYRQQSSSAYSISDLAGKPGTVTFPILPGGTGEVRVAMGSTAVTYSARASDGAGINQGDSVIVVAPGPPLIVKKVTYE